MIRGRYHRSPRHVHYADPDLDPVELLLAAMVRQAKYDTNNGSHTRRRTAREWLDWARAELAPIWEEERIDRPRHQRLRI